MNTDFSEEAPEFVLANEFSHSWKLLSLSLGNMKPKTLREWLAALWGLDIFIEDKIPFMKSLVLANIIVWLIF